jgi:hypothetical protein
VTVKQCYQSFIGSGNCNLLQILDMILKFKSIFNIKSGISFMRYSVSLTQIIKNFVKVINYFNKKCKLDYELRYP